MISTSTKANDKVKQKLLVCGTHIEELTNRRYFTITTTSWMPYIDLIRSWQPILCTAKACDGGKCFFPKELTLLWSSLLSSSKRIKQGSQNMKDFTPSTIWSLGFQGRTGTSSALITGVIEPDKYIVTHPLEHMLCGISRKTNSLYCYFSLRSLLFVTLNRC